MKTILISILLLTVALANCQQHMFHQLSGQTNATVVPTIDTSTLYNNLVAWYDLEETSGTSMVDSFSTNTGTIGVSTTLGASGGQGLGYNFAYGSGNSVTITDRDEFTFTDESFTIAFWVTPDFTYTPRIINKRSNTGYEYAVNMWTSGRVELKLHHNNTSSSSNYYTPNGGLTTNVLIHVVCVVHSGTLNDVNIYINGVNQTLVHDGENTFSMVNSDADVNINFLSGVGWGDMLLSQINFWNDTISQTQVTELYNSGSGIDFSDLFTTE